MHVDLNTNIDIVKRDEQRYLRRYDSWHKHLSDLETALAGKDIDDDEINKVFYYLSSDISMLQNYLENDKEVLRLLHIIDEVAQDIGHLDTWHEYSNTDHTLGRIRNRV
jgi:transcriptional regulator NrdR family protein